MAYHILPTTQTPALIIYLIDVSGSMSNRLSGKSRINVVEDALSHTFEELVSRSIKGNRVLPLYRIGIYAYSDDVYDIFGGIKTIDQIAAMGIPEFATLRSTDTARAFMVVEKALHIELPKISDCPAPLVCHITDGEYTGSDPEPVANRIMSLCNSDGNVLIENLFIANEILDQPIPNLYEWKGITSRTSLKSRYANKLRSMSSSLPYSYCTMLREAGYQIASGAAMMCPGESPESIEFSLKMSISLPRKF